MASSSDKCFKSQKSRNRYRCVKKNVHENIGIMEKNRKCGASKRQVSLINVLKVGKVEIAIVACKNLHENSAKVEKVGFFERIFVSTVEKYFKTLKSRGS